MATERQILTPAAAVSTPPVAPEAPPVLPAAPKPEQSWKFVKNFTPADIFKFKDESEFSFPLIVRNDGSGFSSNSSFTTTDEALAINLRGLTKNRATGVIEVKQ